MDILCSRFGALSDVTRLKILQLLTEHEMCVCEMEDRLEMSQPAVSHHLRVLKKTGLILGRKSGKWMYYSLNGGALVDSFNKFEELFYRTVKDRVAGGLPATPPQDPDNSYCKTRQKGNN